MKVRCEPQSKTFFDGLKYQPSDLLLAQVCQPCLENAYFLRNSIILKIVGHYCISISFDPNVPDYYWLQQEEDLVDNAVVENRAEAATIGKGFNGGNGQPEANDRFPGTGGYHSEQATVGSHHGAGNFDSGDFYGASPT